MILLCKSPEMITILCGRIRGISGAARATDADVERDRKDLAINGVCADMCALCTVSADLKLQLTKCSFPLLPIAADHLGTLPV
jgi:hypothetical protein